MDSVPSKSSSVSPGNPTMTSVVRAIPGIGGINLNAKEKPKWHASITRIVQTAVRAYEAGAYSICFHPGYYLGQEQDKVYAKIKEALKLLFGILEDKGVKIWVRPETTGKATQFGSLKELLQLSAEFDMMLPCVDFAHLHARSNGKYNTTEEFRKVLESMESALGRPALDEMHIHISGIAYSEKGERNHLILKEADFRYKELIQVLKEFKVKGIIICESPNIETDCQLLKKTYAEL